MPNDKWEAYQDELPDYVKNEADFELYKMRHSAEHVFNQAVEELWPGKILRAIGPAIADGFYNDSRWEEKISETDFLRIEQRMRKIIKANLAFTRKEISIEEAKELFGHNPFKMELIEEFASEGKPLSIYYTGDPANPKFVDLCRGPHLDRTGGIGAFKISHIAGAYWRGDEKNEMLTRVYGLVFSTQEELDRYVKQQEDAKARDHRKLGKDLDLFVFSDIVGKGLPLWTPRGATVRRELERFIVDEELKRGYVHVYTPELANLDLYRTSGHYPYYKDSMYAPITIDDEQYMLRPMTCPHHFELYKSKPRSYRELPMRIAELAKLYRYEKSGELTGLIRVRSFCLADSHIITQQENAVNEVRQALNLIEYVAQVLGLKPNVDYWYRLSLGDRKDDKKYYKDDAAWDKAESVLREVLKDSPVNNYEAEGEAAFYGPKIDVQMRNVNGKEDSAFTVQYDFVMPKRFELKYIDSTGNEAEPVVVHRSSIGAIERVMAFLIERYAGNFPLWLAPEQVRIIPISEDNIQYAEKIKAELQAMNIRVEIDTDDDRMQKKILKAQQMKLPVMVIVGKQEAENNQVALRLNNGKSVQGIDLAKFKEYLQQHIAEKKVEMGDIG